MDVEVAQARLIMLVAYIYDMDIPDMWVGVG